MAMINAFQVAATLKPSSLVVMARGLLVGLVVVAASALAGCGGESALFARDAGQGSGTGGVSGVGGVPGGTGGASGSGVGGLTGDAGSAGTGGTQNPDGGSDARGACTDDTPCGTTQFCSAGACVPRFGNLAGNGGLEYGTNAGWYGVFGGGGTLLVSDMTMAGFAHGGRYSAQASSRTQLYHGPAYRLPTGLGKYTVSGWGFQKDDSTLGVNFQVSIICATSIQYLAPITATLTQNVWGSFTATFDTTTVAPTPAGDCSSNGTTVGGVKLSRIFINQVADGTPVVLPDLFFDDVVVQVTDGHNLVGNSNFEAGFTDGWTGGGGTPTISSTVAKTGTHSLFVIGRTATTAGPSYAMPIGAAKYNVVFQGLHTGNSPHDLVLQSTYTCLGGSPTLTAPIATATGVAANVWAPLGGTVALPPADAPPGCQLTDAAVFLRQGETGSCGGTVECPDLYVDDVSIIIPPP